MTLVPVAVLDDDPEVRDQLATQLGSRAEAGAVARRAGRAARRCARWYRARTVVGSAERLAEIAGLLQSHREVGTVLVTDELSTDLLQTALRAGVNDVLASPVEADQLEAAVTRWPRASTSPLPRAREAPRRRRRRRPGRARSSPCSPPRAVPASR